MSKRIFMASLILIGMFQIGWAKKEKTTNYKDSTLTDAKYGYSLIASGNWKIKGFNEPSVERAYLEKKNYSVNQKVRTYGGDYTIPSIVIFAQEFNGTLDDFEALLKKSIDEHISDNEIIKKLGLMRDGEFINSGQIIIDSTKCLQLILKRNYKRLLASDAYGGSSDPTDQPERFINDHEVHELFAIKKGNTLFVIQAYCEREFFIMENRREFEHMANSLKF